MTVFVGGRTLWTLIKWSATLRISSSLVGAEIGTLQVAPASAQVSDGVVITPLHHGFVKHRNDRASGQIKERSSKAGLVGTSLRFPCTARKSAQSSRPYGHGVTAPVPRPPATPSGR